MVTSVPCKRKNISTLLMNPNNRNDLKNRRKRQKTFERDKFSKQISVGDICQINGNVVDTIYVAIDNGELSGINNNGKVRQLIIIYNFEPPKGQRVKGPYYVARMNQDVSGIKEQHRVYQQFRSVGVKVKTLTPESQDEVRSEINSIFKKDLGVNDIPNRIFASLIVFDKELFNDAFEFYIDCIVSIKPQKVKAKEHSQKRIDGEGFNNSILSEVLLNQYQHTDLKKLIAICNDVYGGVSLVIPLLFLIRKQDG